MKNEGIKVFFSYSRKDETLRTEFAAHLTALKWRGVIQDWSDRPIEAGSDWQKAIISHLDSADIILFLLSSDFLASDYSFEEAQRALARHKTGQARLIPVLLRPVDLKSTPFQDMTVSPKDLVPITSWENKDEAFLSVIRDIRKVAEELSLQAAANES
jgi:TIR domain